MKLSRYLMTALAATPAALALLAAPSAVADCNSSGGSSVCADGQVRGPDRGGSNSDSCSYDNRNGDSYRNSDDYRVCAGGTVGTTRTVVPAPNGPAAPVAPVILGPH